MRFHARKRDRQDAKENDWVSFMRHVLAEPEDICFLAIVLGLSSFAPGGHDVLQKIFCVRIEPGAATEVFHECLVE